MKNKYYIEETDSIIEAEIRADKDRHFTAPGEMAIENIITDNEFKQDPPHLNINLDKVGDITITFDGLDYKIGKYQLGKLLTELCKEVEVHV